MSPTVSHAPVADRNPGIDALRAAVTLLVIFHHAALTYGAIGGWYYREIAPSATPASLLLVLFCTINQAWFMGFFFLLAGYYTPGACARRGVPAFVGERLLRLGLPLLVYAILLHPLTVALSATARGRPFLATLASLWRRTRFEPGPLWFAEALLLFTAAWLLWRSLRGTQTQHAPALSGAVLAAAALVVGASAFALRLVWPVGTDVLFLQLGYFPSYVALFAAGCAAAGGRRLDRLPGRRVRAWVIVTLVALPLFPLLVVLGTRVPGLGGRAEGGWTVPALGYAFWEPFVAWGTILGLLALFQRRFCNHAEVLRGALSRMARRAYLMFVIHPPVLVGTALAWRGIPSPALVKWVTSGSVACLLCYLAAGLLLRIPGVGRVV